MTLLERNYIDDLYQRTGDLFSGRGRSAYITIIDNASFTILDDDGYSLVELSGTLNVDRTITLPTLAANQRRFIRFIDISTHGTKAWSIAGEGAETVNGFAAIGSIHDARGWHLDIWGGPSEWVRVGGIGIVPVTPVAVEASWNPTSTPETKTCTGARTLTPAGARRAFLFVEMTSSDATRAVALRATGGSDNYVRAYSQVANVPSISSGWVPLDANRDFDINASHLNISDVDVYMTAYSYE